MSGPRKRFRRAKTSYSHEIKSIEANETPLPSILATRVVKPQTRLNEAGDPAIVLHYNPLQTLELTDRDIVQMFVSLDDWPKWHGLPRKRRAIFVDIELESLWIIWR